MAVATVHNIHGLGGASTTEMWPLLDIEVPSFRLNDNDHQSVTANGKTNLRTKDLIRLCAPKRMHFPFLRSLFPHPVICISATGAPVSLDPRRLCDSRRQQRLCVGCPRSPPPRRPQPRASAYRGHSLKFLAHFHADNVRRLSHQTTSSCLFLRYVPSESTGLHMLSSPLLMELPAHSRSFRGYSGKASLFTET